MKPEYIGAGGFDGLAPGGTIIDIPVIGDFDTTLDGGAPCLGGTDTP